MAKKRKSRGRQRPARPAPPAEPAEGAEATEGGYARSRAKSDAARAALKPLAPGERPGAVTVAAVLAASIAVANLVLFAAGVEVRGQEPQAFGVVLFAILMGLGAFFMWRGRYWAVLGFQALLGISIAISALSLLVATNLQGAVLSLTVMLAGGTLFWFLVRAMARIQMPERGRRAEP